MWFEVGRMTRAVVHIRLVCPISVVWLVGFLASATEPTSTVVPIPNLDPLMQHILDDYNEIYSGYPEGCRPDVCGADDGSSAWCGNISWEPTYAGYRRIIDCPYAHVRQGVSSRDCLLSYNDTGIIASWEPAHVADCPGTPVNESLRYTQEIEMDSLASIDDALEVLCEGIGLQAEYGVKIEDIEISNMHYLLENVAAIYKKTGAKMNQTTATNYFLIGDTLIRSYGVSTTHESMTALYNTMLWMVGQLDVSDGPLQISFPAIMLEIKAIPVTPTLYATHTTKLTCEEDAQLIMAADLSAILQLSPSEAPLAHAYSIAMALHVPEKLSASGFLSSPSQAQPTATTNPLPVDTLPAVSLLPAWLGTPPPPPDFLPGLPISTGTPTSSPSLWFPSANWTIIASTTDQPYTYKEEEYYGDDGPQYLPTDAADPALVAYYVQLPLSSPSPPDMIATDDMPPAPPISLRSMMIYQTFVVENELRRPSPIILQASQPLQVPPVPLAAGTAWLPLDLTDMPHDFLEEECVCGHLGHELTCSCYPRGDALLALFVMNSSSTPFLTQTSLPLPELLTPIMETGGINEMLGFTHIAEIRTLEMALRAISLACLVLTVLTYLVYRRSRRGTTTTILLHLCISIIAVIIITCITENIENTIQGCIVATVLRTYFILVSLMWNGVEAVHMYLQFVQVFNAEVNQFVAKAAILAWGLPVVPICTAFAVDIQAFNGHFDSCQLLCTPKRLTIYLAVLVPILLIVFFNLIIFTLVIRQIASLYVGPDKGVRRERAVRLVGALALLVLLGVPWIFAIFGVMEVPDDNTAVSVIEGIFQTLFVVLVNSQGIFIFLFYCIRIPDVRASWVMTFNKVTPVTPLTAATSSEA